MVTLRYFFSTVAPCRRNEKNNRVSFLLSAEKERIVVKGKKEKGGAQGHPTSFLSLSHTHFSSFWDPGALLAQTRSHELEAVSLLQHFIVEKNWSSMFLFHTRCCCVANKQHDRIYWGLLPFAWASIPRDFLQHLRTMFIFLRAHILKVSPSSPPAKWNWHLKGTKVKGSAKEGSWRGCKKRPMLK